MSDFFVLFSTIKGGESFPYSLPGEGVLKWFKETFVKVSIYFFFFSALINSSTDRAASVVVFRAPLEPNSNATLAMV